MLSVAQIEKVQHKVKSGADFSKYIQDIKQLCVVLFTSCASGSSAEYFENNNFQTNSQEKHSNLEI